MKTADFLFDLPESLIAQYPPPVRGRSRLMVLDRASGKRRHRLVEELPEILTAPVFGAASAGPSGVSSGSGPAGLAAGRLPLRKPGLPTGKPLLVFNNSRVRRARLVGISRDTGKEGEFLLIRRCASHTWQAMVKKAKRRRPGSRYVFAGGLEGEITEAEDPWNLKPEASSGEFLCLRFDAPIDDEWLDRYGHIPLPPYIRRPDEPGDGERYQTVYADRSAGAGLGPGASVAAPTAGLHFTGELLHRLGAAGIDALFVTLHVGPGTFLPVRTGRIEDHVMHEEAYSIGEEEARRINEAKADGRALIAVGTTTLRTLESAWTDSGRLRAGGGSAGVFIYPGYRFKAVDALFTNFHTPASTLLMLVSAFAGRDLILESYAEAVREGYRFFSYGDAMLIL